jgi:hypothetical protein
MRPLDRGPFMRGAVVVKATHRGGAGRSRRALCSHFELEGILTPQITYADLNWLWLLVSVHFTVTADSKSKVERVILFLSATYCHLKLLRR